MARRSVAFGRTRGVAVLAVAASAMAVATAPAMAATASPPSVSKVSPTSGKTAGGTRVTVYGTSFTSVKAVHFGTVSGTSIKVLSSMKLQVTAPAHKAGWVDVRVVTSYGTSATHTADHYTYVSPPSITAITPTSGKTSGGTRVTITGLRFAHVISVHFGSTAGTSITVLSSTKLQVTAPAHASGLIRVAITTSYGTSPSVTADHYTYVAPPGPVTGLSVTASTTTSVTLQWTNPASTNFTGVMIRRAAGATPPSSVTSGTFVHTTAGATISYTNTGLAVGTTYSYSLFAHSSADAYAAAAKITTATQAFVFAAPVTAVSGLGAPTSISCPSVDFCTAVDDRGHAVIDSGGTWQSPIAVAGSEIRAISCVSSTFCMAVSGDGSAFEFNGTNWAAGASLTSDTLADVSCASIAFCAAVDSDGNAYLYTGIWSAAMTVSTAAALTSVSCPAPAVCTAADAAGAIFALAAGAWSGPTQVSSASGGGIRSLSCPIPGMCAASDTEGNVYIDANSSWSAATSIGGDTTNRLLVDCTSATICVALGDDGTWSRYDGLTWTSPASVAVSAPVAGIACAIATSCTAITADGHTIGFNGSTWATGVSADTPSSGLIDASCATATSCTAIDGSGNALTLNGTIWGAPLPLNLPGQPTSISCPTTNFCAVVDDTGHAVTRINGAWSAPVALTTGEHLTAIACTSSTFCATVADTGDAWTYIDGNLTVDGSVEPAGNLTDITCPTSSFCAATGSTGRVVTFNGATWSAPASVSSGPLTGISCVDASHCEAVDDAGNAFSFVGGTWTGPKPIDADALTAVSCISASVCVAVDDGGGELTLNSHWSGRNTVLAGPANTVTCTAGPMCLITDYTGAVVRSAATSGFSTNTTGYVRAATTTAAQPSNCPTMQLFGVRGSGEKDTDHNGYGDTVGSVVDQIEASIPGAHAFAIDYPAIPVWPGNVSLGNEVSPAVGLAEYGLADYPASVRAGVQALDHAISGFFGSLCTDTKIYLIGYSQGAQVVGDEFQKLMTGSNANRVGGVAMIGDPKFKGSQGGPVNAGSWSDRINGVQDLTSTPRSIPPNQQNLIRSYCVYNDPICQNTARNAATCAVGAPFKACVHQQYMTLRGVDGYTYTQDAARFLVQRWRTTSPSGGAPVIITTELLPGSVAAHYAASVTTSDHRTGTWTITSGSLPPGLTLSGYTISGTPTTAATYHFTIQFTDTSHRTTSASLSITIGTQPGTWAAIAGPQPTGYNIFSGLNAVSCPSALLCVAVSGGGVIEMRSAGLWSPQVAALPPGTTPAPGGSGQVWAAMDAVSCSSDQFCVAVGSYHDSTGYPGILETFSNGSWTQTRAPLPPDASSEGGVQLVSASCPYDGYCVAVGSYSTASFRQFGLIETYENGQWFPTVAPALAAGDDGSMLDSVDCGADYCQALGAVNIPSIVPGEVDAYVPLSESLSGGMWTPAEIPLPADAVQMNAISQLDCTSSTNCVAVGTYVSSADVPTPDGVTPADALIVKLANGTWTSLRAPMPAGAQATDSRLQSVSCVGQGICSAVGQYTTATGPHSALVEALTNGTWAPSAAPLPSGVSSSASSILTSIACIAPGPCTAVGNYTVGTAPSRGLIATLGGSPAAITAPVPESDAGPGTYELSEVACLTSTACVAVGDSGGSIGQGTIVSEG